MTNPRNYCLNLVAENCVKDIYILFFPNFTSVLKGSKQMFLRTGFPHSSTSYIDHYDIQM
jgi:hypothetical protein